MVRRISSGFLATSNPFTEALPDVGVNRPHNMRITVDFPAPLGPRNPKISPFSTARETSSTATKRAEFLHQVAGLYEFMP